MTGPSRDPPDRPARPPATRQSSERRYTEEELAVILNRAAERQEGAQSSTPRYSLADIQEIAAGAGIAPDHVASVAAALRADRMQRGGGFLGAPHRFRFEESIEGELSDDTIAELFDLARREIGAQGSVSDALGTVEWKAQDAFGATHVSVSRRGGRTTIAVLHPRTDAAVVTATAGVVGGFAASAGLAGLLLGVVGLDGPLVPLVAIAGGAGSAWAAMRGAWRRVARRADGRTESLGAALVAVARRGADEDRGGR